MSFDYCIWLLANRKERIAERFVDFALLVSAFMFLASAVVYGILFVGFFVPDSVMWLVAKHPPREADLTEMWRDMYVFMRGVFIISTVLFYCTLALFVIWLPLACLRQHFNECRGEYEEEVRLRQLYEKKLKGENLNSSLLHV